MESQENSEYDDEEGECCHSFVRRAIGSFFCHSASGH